MNYIIFFLLIIISSACDRVDFELQKMSKAVQEEEAKLAAVADGTRVIDGDPEPKWPGDAGDKTVEGIDADNDGVRDDVEIWINENVKDNNLGHHENLRRAIKQFVRDQTKFILGHELPKEELFKLHEQGMRSRECANFFWFLIHEREQDKNKYTGIVYPKILSTYQRLKAYDLADQKRGSFIYSDPGQQATLARFCNFKITHLEEYIDQYKKESPDHYKNLKIEDLQ